MSKLYLLLLFFFVIFFIVTHKSFIVKRLQGKTKTLQKLHKRNTQV
jgi:cell division protein FtsI/penicillin-binding protein 2